MSTANGSPDIDEMLTADEDLRSLLSGGWIRYRTSPALQHLTREAHSTCATFNRIFYDDPQRAMLLFRELVPATGEGVDVRAPITLDYGMRLEIGDRTFINTDFLVVGGGRVVIGADCLIGPRCAIYTPNHALDITRRLEGWELPQPVTIGDNVWLGGSVTITPGVTIGDNTVIGAGSVVTNDIPEGVIAAGNPCRVLRELPAR